MRVLDLAASFDLQRLTRRPLPLRDEVVDAMDAEARAHAAAIWTGRVRSELDAGSGFAILLGELHATGAELAVLRLASRAAHDEVRHAELCRVLASTYAGELVAAPRGQPIVMPTHGGAEGALRTALHAFGLCCVNETIAVAFVDACLAESHAPLVSAIHHEHLADEIDHARVGWAHLASAAVPDDVRRAVAARAPRIIEANRKRWRSRIGLLPEAGIPGHGYPSRQALLDVVDAALRDVVSPGLTHIGLG